MRCLCEVPGKVSYGSDAQETPIATVHQIQRGVGMSEWNFQGYITGISPYEHLNFVVLAGNATSYVDTEVARGRLAFTEFYNAQFDGEVPVFQRVEASVR